MNARIYPVKVHYWTGTRKNVGTATTARGALRIAQKNQNSYGPRFYADDSRELTPVFDVDGAFRGLGDANHPELVFG